jgi:apolipoprotein D and lipocalin family protein
MRTLALTAVLMLGAQSASAASPEPTKPLDLDRFMGRWYEILRTPNGNQKNCGSAYQDWRRRSAERFAIDQNCRRPDGSWRRVATSAKVVDPERRAKFEASFFGGLIKGRYWVVDRADDYSWMIATTEDGNYPALLARTPTIGAGEEARLKARMAALGFNVSRLRAYGPAPGLARAD